MKKIRIGIAGAGNAGMMHLKSLTGGNFPETEVVAICDKTGRLEALKNDEKDVQKKLRRKAAVKTNVEKDW